VLADIDNDLGDQDKALEYGLLSAHLNYKTPAEEWARLGHMCEESDKWDQAAIVYGRGKSRVFTIRDLTLEWILV
jgi:hypothetical protein